MISDRETNKIFFSNQLKIDFPYTCTEIEHVLNSFGIQPYFLPETKDIWARDYMPIQIAKDVFVEYRYDPDYLQGTTKNRRELKTYPDIVCDAIKLPTKKTDIILDGGNVVKSKNAIILTDKVVVENKRTYNKHQLLDKLHEIFQVDKVVLIPWDDKCEFGHSDGMLRFINDDTVLISGFYDTADLEFKEFLLKSLKKAKLNWEWLRCSNKEKERNIAYINFLQTKDLILIPKLYAIEDEIAFEQVSKYYNDYSNNKRITQVDMSETVKLGGALNCVTWTIME
ncbi:agmatine deiminase family protein [Prolixibacteraceae bacterium Z1-6]|uniref:Agmatine deiminase family protein n=1 Tax=Draconibacterium aestuarii TaxID=2998507 RepID=A0A9X3F2E1_9BACT|nr:agmatine deiminase family protein [Prolixibacteraceae bacterium Z1-6]